MSVELDTELDDFDDVYEDDYNIDQMMHVMTNVQHVALELTKLIANPNGGNDINFVLNTYQECLTTTAGFMMSCLDTNIMEEQLETNH